MRETVSSVVILWSTIRHELNKNTCNSKAHLTAPLLGFWTPLPLTCHWYLFFPLSNCYFKFDSASLCFSCSFIYQRVSPFSRVLAFPGTGQSTDTCMQMPSSGCFSCSPQGMTELQERSPIWKGTKRYHLYKDWVPLKKFSPCYPTLPVMEELCLKPAFWWLQK